MIKDGILNINKPAGMTSHDVVYRVRKATRVKRVGHTGTLDPMATGVLPVCIGSAARITEYLDLDFKTYRCEMELGKVTDTLDVWGEILEERSTEGIGEEDVRNAFSSFHGLIEQTPPMYSAVKVNGRKLYEYAREGMEVKVKSRSVYIKELNIEAIDLVKKKITFVVECSKGTYIRSICGDVGEKLGCGGIMTGLVRLASGFFSIEDSIEHDSLSSMEIPEIEAKLLGADFPLVHFGKVIVDGITGEKFVNGFHLPLSNCRIIREPEFKEKDFVMEIRPEYRRAYNIYMKEAGHEAGGGRESGRDAGGEVFLGTAFYSLKYKKLVADKVFYRR